MGVDFDRVRRQGSFLFVVYRERYLLPGLFGNRFLRSVYVGTYVSNADLDDPVSLLSVLNEETRLDWSRDREQDLGRWWMEVWDPAAHACARSGYCDHRPLCGPIYPRWKYTPQLTRSTDGFTYAA